MDEAPISQSEQDGKKRKKKRKKGPYIPSDEDLEGDDGQFGIFTKPSKQELALMEDSMTSVQTGEMHDYQLEKRDEIKEKEKAKVRKQDTLRGWWSVCLSDSCQTVSSPSVLNLTISSSSYLFHPTPP